MNVMTLVGWLLFALICGSSVISASENTVATYDLKGVWGGEHIQLTVSEKAVNIEFDSG